MGHPIETTTPIGSVWLDPFAKATDVFKMQMGIVGLTIMMLFGFAKCCLFIDFINDDVLSRIHS